MLMQFQARHGSIYNPSVSLYAVVYDCTRTKKWLSHFMSDIDSQTESVQDFAL